MAIPSKTQIDKLGERLESGHPSEADLRELDEYRRSFGDAYETVVATIEEKLTRGTTGRRAKTTSAIIEKLQRESIRLTQIQDIAGCRLVVDDLNEQDEMVASLVGAFPGAVIVDRRQRPMATAQYMLRIEVPLRTETVETPHEIVRRLMRLLSNLGGK